VLMDGVKRGAGRAHSYTVQAFFLRRKKCFLMCCVKCGLARLLGYLVQAFCCRFLEIPAVHPAVISGYLVQAHVSVNNLKYVASAAPVVMLPCVPLLCALCCLFVACLLLCDHPAVHLC